MDNEKIGKYIKKKRKKINITQEKLGELLGVTGKAVSKWECGSALPDPTLYIPLSEVLKIDVSELLNGEDSKDKPEAIRKRKSILMIILIIITILSLSFTFAMGIYYRNNYDEVHIYKLSSENKSFSIKGEIVSVDDKNYVYIYNIGYLGKNEINGSPIKYQLFYKDKVIFEKYILEGYYDEIFKIPVSKLLNLISFSTSLNEAFNYSGESYLKISIDFLNDKNKITNINIKLNVK